MRVVIKATSKKHRNAKNYNETQNSRLFLFLESFIFVKQLGCEPASLQRPRRPAEETSRHIGSLLKKGCFKSTFLLHNPTQHGKTIVFSDNTRGSASRREFKNVICRGPSKSRFVFGEWLSNSSGGVKFLKRIPCPWDLRVTAGGSNPVRGPPKLVQAAPAPRPLCHPLYNRYTLYKTLWLIYTAAGVNFCILKQNRCFPTNPYKCEWRKSW